MTISRILDESIVEPPPPFRDLDGLIARERRRWRARRAAAASAAVAGVLIAAVGLQSLLGTAGGPEPLPPTAAPMVTWLPPDPSPVPVDETAQQRAERLDVLVERRATAAVPGVAVSADGEPWFSRVTMFAGYEDVSARLHLVTRAGTTDLDIVVSRPLVPPYPRGSGCVPPELTSDRCEVLTAPGDVEVAVTRRGETELLVTANFANGGRVTVRPSADPLTAEQLAQIVADPAFVAGYAVAPYQPAHVGSNVGHQPRHLPPDPQLGVAYPVDLYSHCGIDLMSFAGHVWRSVEPDDGSFPGAFISGTLELLEGQTARFVLDQEVNPAPHEVIVYRWTDEQVPPCD